MFCYKDIKIIQQIPEYARIKFTNDINEYIKDKNDMVVSMPMSDCERLLESMAIELNIYLTCFLQKNNLSCCYSTNVLVTYEDNEINVQLPDWTEEVMKGETRYAKLGK